MASVEQRATHWRVVWRQSGEKQYELFPTSAQAERFCQLVEAHGNRWPHGWTRGHGLAEQHSDVPTFAEWATRAINSRSRANDRTRHDYRRDVDLHLAEPFGAVPLDLITREMVGQWLIKLSKTASAKTVKNVHGLASSIVADAVSAQIVPYNPFRGALKSVPKVKVEEMVFLSRGEFDTMLAGVGQAYQPLVRLLALTGLRWSEATALRVSDIDVLARKLRVVRAWKRTPESYFELGEPKSERARRTITIPKSLAEDLIPLTASRRDQEFLFLSPMGRPVRHANFRERVWLPAVKAMQRCDTHAAAAKPCGCAGTVTKTPRIHDLRHSHASWLIAAGYSLVRIQYRLGHESIKTTIDRYGHLEAEAGDEITAALDGVPTELPTPDPAEL